MPNDNRYIPSEAVELSTEFFTLMLKAVNPKIKEALVYEILLPFFIEMEEGAGIDMEEAVSLGQQILATENQSGAVH